MNPSVTRSLGLEIEFHLVDSLTHRPVGIASDLEHALNGQLLGELHPELFEDVGELVSPPCRNLAELEDVVSQDWERVLRTCLELGAVPVLSGQLPLPSKTERRLRDTPRNRSVEDRLGGLTDQLQTAGLHIHVQCDSRNPQSLNRLAVEAGTSVALSCSSPDFGGGPRSLRMHHWAGGRLPVSGLPPVLESPSAWKEHLAWLRRTNQIQTEKDIYYLCRFSGRYPTVEQRAFDSLEFSHLFPLAAWTQVLVVGTEKGDHILRNAFVDQRNLDQAIALGTEAEFVDERGHGESLVDRLDRLLDDHHEIAVRLRATSFLDQLKDVVIENSCQAQQSLFDTTSSLDAVMKFLMKQSQELKETNLN